jgi:hypothetical protein
MKSPCILWAGSRVAFLLPSKALIIDLEKKGGNAEERYEILFKDYIFFIDFYIDFILILRLICMLFFILISVLDPSEFSHWHFFDEKAFHLDCHVHFLRIKKLLVQCHEILHLFKIVSLSLI